jgi:hypothetical protein
LEYILNLMLFPNSQLFLPIKDGLLLLFEDAECVIIIC